MNDNDTPKNTLEVIYNPEKLVVGTFELYDDEAAAVLSLIEVFLSRRR